jgi:hypothetical protein
MLKTPDGGNISLDMIHFWNVLVAGTKGAAIREANNRMISAHTRYPSVKVTGFDSAPRIDSGNHPRLQRCWFGLLVQKLGLGFVIQLARLGLCSSH